MLPLQITPLDPKVLGGCRRIGHHGYDSGNPFAAACRGLSEGKMPLNSEELRDVSELLLEYRQLALRIDEEKSRPSPDGDMIRRLHRARLDLRGHIARLLDAG